MSRALLSLMLLVSLLAPGVLLAAYDSSPTCGMSCCKRAKTCCCHRSDKAAGGLYWTAAPTCPPGCRQMPGANSGLVVAVVQSESTDRWIPPAARVTSRPARLSRQVLHRTALFERPPPASRPGAC